MHSMTDFSLLRLEITATSDGAAILRVWPDDGEGNPATLIVPMGETVPLKLYGRIRDLFRVGEHGPSGYLVYDGCFRHGRIR